MFKQLVVLSSFIAGAGAAGMGMYLQYNPLAFTRAPTVNLNTYLYSELQPKPEAKQTLHAARPAPIEIKAADPTDNAALDNADVLELPPVIVTRSPKAMTWHVAPVAHRVAPAAQQPVNVNDQSDIEFLTPIDEAGPKSTKPLKPCSGFRELGPTHVDDGIPTGVRGVRDLC